MSSQNYNFPAIVAGDTYPAILLSFDQTVDNGKTFTAKVFPVGTTAMCRIKKQWLPLTVIYTFGTAVSGQTVTLAEISAATTKSFPVGNDYLLELRITTPDGVSITYIDDALIDVKEDSFGV